MRIKNNIKGDTIIEVLVCLAVLGFAMTVAYSISTRNLQVIRQSQERAEALKIAEGQIETLKSLQQSNPTSFRNIANRNTVICVRASGSVDFSVGNVFNASNLAGDTFNYPNDCKQGLYNIAIVPPNSTTSPAGGVFKIYVRWNKFGGGVNEQLSMEYILYENN
jgi:Tfp pilus assembly protein PilV